MGNTPSSHSKPATPTPPNSSNAVDSPRAQRKDKLHHPHHIRSPASPEATTVQAQGSTINNRGSQSRPLAILNSSPPTSSSASSPAQPRAFSSPRQTVEPRHEEPTKPVAVPQSHHDPGPFGQGSHPDEGLISGPPSSSIQDMSYHMSRPPRLPLPIEEEIHTPGSPIASAEDTANDADVNNVPPIEEQHDLPRHPSGLSNVTDEEDAEELRVDKTGPTLPTRITWLRGGQKVYVTGTPFQWGRKQRLHPAKGEEGVLETTIRVFPGTHHIKFLVDGNMQTSPDLPTTVDFGNNLVNYIEVSGEVPSVRIHVEPGIHKAEDAQRLESAHPSGVELPQEAPKKRSFTPTGTFSAKLPQYLQDFDQPEESPYYKISAVALEKLPTPPALPGFLGKPIMNNVTLIKDDNSVLNMPNHTVLNHLATCSIKNNVLAVSATTRYKDKYVTTIVYKPTKK